MATKISVINLCSELKTSNRKTSVINEINTVFFSNEHLGLMGRNGSGKTSFIRLLGGLEKPSAGKIMKSSLSCRIMLMLQRAEDQFIRGTVGEQIHSYSSKSRDAEEIHNLMKQVGLPEFLGRQSPARLSTGQQRLVAIACALATDAEMIILDEPMAGLDASGRRLVRNALLQMRNFHDLGWIIVSHHPDDLLGIVERLWVLDDGKLLHDGAFDSTPVNILNKCLSSNDPSIYRTLRKLEETGVIFNVSPYGSQDAEKIAHILENSNIK